MEIKNWWETQHELFNTGGEIEFITSSALGSYFDFFKCEELYNNAESVLEIGVGTGRALKEMTNKKLYATDISDKALDRVKDIAETCHTEELKENVIDLAICNLVAQHISNETLSNILKYAIASLKINGTLVLQHADALGDNEYSLKLILEGGMLKDKETVKKIVEENNGVITFEVPRRYFNDNTVWWDGIHIRRVS